MTPIIHINPSGCYTLAEVAWMIGVSPATARREVGKGHLTRIKGIGALRITHASVEALLAPAASGPFCLAAEIRKHGPCLVLESHQLGEMMRVCRQTAYRQIAAKAWKPVPHLTNRRVLKSAVAAALGVERLSQLEDAA